MNSTKLELRKVLKAKRLALTPAEREQKSLIIIQKLAEAIDWSKAVSVHCFEPIESLGEVNVISLFNDKDNVFTSRKTDGEWGKVSLEGNQTIPEQFDVIIVPMLGFDKNLHRIGYGGGYYDKFLATQPQAQKIGVCFEIGHVEKLPVETHDMALDVIVTETTAYNR